MGAYLSQEDDAVFYSFFDSLQLLQTKLARGTVCPVVEDVEQLQNILNILLHEVL